MWSEGLDRKGTTIRGYKDDNRYHTVIQYLVKVHLWKHRGQMYKWICSSKVQWRCLSQAPQSPYNGHLACTRHRPHIFKTPTCLCWLLHSMSWLIHQWAILNNKALPVSPARGNTSSQCSTVAHRGMFPAKWTWERLNWDIRHFSLGYWEVKTMAKPPKQLDFLEWKH